MEGGKNRLFVIKEQYSQELCTLERNQNEVIKNYCEYCNIDGEICVETTKDYCEYCKIDAEICVKPCNSDSQETEKRRGSHPKIFPIGSPRSDIREQQNGIREQQNDVEDQQYHIGTCGSTCNENHNINTEDSISTLEQTKSLRQGKILKASLLTFLVCIITYIILDHSLPNLGYVSRIITAFLLWVEMHPAEGVVAFAGVYILTTVLFIPGSLLTLGAGLVFGRALGLGLGVLLASTAVFFGASVGAIVSFLLGRYILQNTAQKMFLKFSILTAIDKAIETEGLKLVLLLRLSPVIPFSAFNYVMGLTRVFLKDYVIGCLGMLPGTVAYVFIGTSAANLLGEADEADGASSGGNNSVVTTVVLVVGAVATVIAVVLITIASKRALNKVLKLQEERMEEQISGSMEESASDVEFKWEERC